MVLQCESMSKSCKAMPPHRLRHLCAISERVNALDDTQHYEDIMLRPDFFFFPDASHSYIYCTLHACTDDKIDLYAHISLSHCVFL